MTDSYVPLRRRFNDVTKEASTALSRRMLGDNDGETWEKILAPPTIARSAIVILAPSGHGKTAELNARAAAMAATGVAFFIRAVALATSGLAAAFHGQDSERLRAWLGSTELATFFIDAFDEARLEGHDLEHVLLRFAREVDPSTRQVRLVLSSRIDVWSQEDLRHLVRLLALPTENPPVRVVRLEPLSLDDVQVYAKANGVRDDASFSQALREEEVEQLFDIRPPDAKVLVDYWKTHGAFGSWSEMLESSVEASVRDENRRHATQQQFTLEEARSGLARIGAATVLGKRSLVSLRGNTNHNEVSAERLFADRRPAAISQLLAMGLFTQKGLHSVQLQQGATSHFLAARWLGERAERGCDPQALENALFIVPFDSGQTIVPPSRSQLVGWVGGRVPPLRKRLLRELPHVLLFEGDPAKLSRGECIEALRAVLRNMRSGGHDVTPTRGTLRQIAKHEIADAVVRLLGEFSGLAPAERLLLRIAEVGRYPSASSIALALALSSTTDDEVVQVAVAVLGAVGSSSERAALLQLVTHQSEWVRLAMVQALAPETLNGAQLVQLVLSVEDRNVAYLLGHALHQIALSDIDTILVALSPRLMLSDSSMGTEAHLEIAVRLLVSRLERNPTDVPSWLPHLLVSVESHLTGPLFISSEDVELLKSRTSERVELRRAIWEERLSIENGAPGVELLWSPKFGIAQPEDIDWLWERQRETNDEKAKMAFMSLLDDALHRVSEAVRLELVKRSDLPAELRAHIEVKLSTQAYFDAMRREKEAKQAAEKAASRAKNITEIQPLRAGIESGQNAGALVWGWRHLKSADDRRGRLGTAQLVEAVGAEMTEVFLTGFQRWWRHHDPTPREPGKNEMPLLDLAGLTGLAIDIERGLDVAALTDAEVVRAVGYALYEMNGFPIWFDALLSAHPSTVRAILANLIREEWNASVEHHGVISRGPYERLPIMEQVRELVVEQLEAGPPSHLNTVSDAVALLIQPPRFPREVASLFRREVLSHAESDVAIVAEWVRGWSHFAPNDAAAWLRALSVADVARFVEVIEQVASLLEADLGRRDSSIDASAWTPQALEGWVRLLHIAVRPEDDIDRVNMGGYSPGKRDRAQEFRSRCVNLLAREPSRTAFEALRRIRRSPEMQPYAEAIEWAQHAQLTAAAEHLATPWSESDILVVERGDERIPKNNAELFGLVLRHLDRVAELIENHDFSYAALFGEKTDEKEVQCWVASSLMLVSRGLYTVEREPEVQDDKLMDISVTVPGVGRVPIEIKSLSQ